MHVAIQYHRDIVPHDFMKIQGGGMFRINEETNTCLFFGSSHQFNSVSYEQLQQCIKQDKVFLGIDVPVNISQRYKFTYNNGYETIELN